MTAHSYLDDLISLRLIQFTGLGDKRLCVLADYPHIRPSESQLRFENEPSR